MAMTCQEQRGRPGGRGDAGGHGHDDNDLPETAEAGGGSRWDAAGVGWLRERRSAVGCGQACRRSAVTRPRVV
eukprot:364641-Chlamydomonas_euryale.AAC.6